MGFLLVVGGVVCFDYLNYWWVVLIESGKVGCEECFEVIIVFWDELYGDW